tara:strand:+ start:119 stop:568 length:450 start_codon:yes stop_codon:yes gene_type:complete
VKKKIKKLLKLYSFEIVLFFLVLTGLFLLVVDIDLKKNIRNLISLTHLFTKEFLNFISYNLIGGIKIIKFSNLLGFLILLICFYLTFKRWKSRLIKSSNNSRICEKCNTTLKRINKSNFLKFLEIFMQLKIRLYKCDKCHEKYKLCKKK